MSVLLSIQDAFKAYPDGEQQVAVLRGLSLEIAPAAQIGIYGKPRSGKSTLLRIAVGLEPPDSGAVVFEGHPLDRMASGERARLLRRSVAFIPMGAWRTAPGEEVLDHVAMALGSDGFTPRAARRKALRVLKLVDPSLAREGLALSLLSSAERARVALARALVRDPGLLVVDEPAVMPSTEDCTSFNTLLRELARERSTALLAASAEMSAVQGMDALMSLSAGELLCSTQPSGEPQEPATVVQLSSRRPSAPGAVARSSS